MPKYIPLLDAQKLAKANARQLEKLQKKHREFEAEAANAEKKLDAAFTGAYENFLGPFAEAFARLKNVTLDDLPTTRATPELAFINVELRGVGLKAVEGLTVLAGGGAAGATVGGLTFPAVGAFATASTGAAIGGLSGAAATSATLAWLGGGSLAAGGYGVAGGAVVLGGLVAAPVLVALSGFVYYKGKAALRDQKTVEVKLRNAAADLRSQREAARLPLNQIRRTSDVIDRLTTLGQGPLAYFTSLVEHKDDFLTYDKTQQEMVAELAGLATTIAAVIACPIVDERGRITAVSSEALSAADTLLARKGQA